MTGNTIADLIYYVQVIGSIQIILLIVVAVAAVAIAQAVERN